jgi:hypothetical protein
MFIHINVIEMRFHGKGEILGENRLFHGSDGVGGKVKNRWGRESTKLFF